MGEFEAGLWVVEVLFWQLAQDPGLDKDRLKTLCVTTFIGGLARVAAARRSGRPHLLFQVLTAAELITPPVLLALRRHMDTPLPPPGA